MTAIVERIHFCTTCNATTVWCMDSRDTTKAFCCRCGEIEELADGALLD